MLACAAALVSAERMVGLKMGAWRHRMNFSGACNQFAGMQQHEPFTQHSPHQETAFESCSPISYPAHVVNGCMAMPQPPGAGP